MASADSSKTALGIVAFLLIVGVASFFLIKSESGNSGEAWLDRHHTIYRELQATLDEFRNAELAHQNYIGTNNEDYLSQFKAAVARGNEHLFNLRDSYNADGVSNDRFRTLEQRIHAINEQLRLSAEVRKQRGEKLHANYFSPAVKLAKSKHLARSR